jgi:phosphoglycolate phosphatase
MMSKIRVSVLITDLDNTLYDWVTFFSESFYDMVDVATGILGVSKEQLLDQLHLVHQSLHSSEHPYAILATEAVRNRFPNLSRREQAAALDEAFHAFNRTRKQTLRLYDGVESSLKTIHDSGALIIAHTEATVPNALFRLRQLGIECYFDHIYASTPQGFEPPVTAVDNILGNTNVIIHYLPIGERKPNPKVLEDISQELCFDHSEAVYVGDSISRDMGMAKAAGLWAAWAQYGTNFEKGHWERLVRITHWTKEDVERAKLASQLFGSVQPDFTLTRSFDEILDKCMFKSHSHT